MRILAFAYACDPSAGSESGAGWMWARLLTRLGDVWVITRANNRSLVESALRQVPESRRLHFIYVDLPAWARFWKQGNRGARLYYMLWQVAALKRAIVAHRQEQFGVVWHITIANAWLGSLGSLVGPPLILGPVGGGQSVPLSMSWTLGIRGLCFELIRELARYSGRYLNPLARIAWRRAPLILALNPATAAWFPRRHRHKVVVFPNAILEQSLIVKGSPPKGTPTALFAGRLVPWKGPGLALRAIAHTTDWRLLVCGTGSQSNRLVQLARRLNIEDRVTFLGFLPRHELLRLMREQAHAFLFPSLRDDSPWVVAEALACGLPIVCIGGGGSALLAGPAGVPTSNRKQSASIVDGLVEGLQRVSLVHQSDVQERAHQLLLDGRAMEMTRILRLHLGRAEVASNAREGQSSS